MILSTECLLGLLHRQLKVWPMAAANFRALENIDVKEFMVGGLHWRVQHNPARIASTAAKVDGTSVAARPCFLCDANRPVQQLEISAGDGYKVLVNPFPIFPVHFTIPAVEHVPQYIAANGCVRFGDMLCIARSLPGLALFYNGAACGASAPDHFHFQAVRCSDLPLFGWLKECPEKIPFRVEAATFSDISDGCRWLAGVCSALSELAENSGLLEPRINILCAANGDGCVQVAVIPRRAHRPDFYGSAPSQLLISPASVDLAGVVISPSADDFHHKISAEILRRMFLQTCYCR